ncbi:MAG TPA: proprotein convertase P-domain-containing protein [Myxococcales bacterium]|nr:proprotein convertase P-domain-containing protein [Myxococcales bacterium]
MSKVSDTRTSPQAPAAMPSAPPVPQSDESSTPAQVSPQRRLPRNQVINQVASSFGAADTRPAFGRRFTPASNEHVSNAQARGLGFEAREAAVPGAAAQGPATVSNNVNVSNEAGPQSETDVAIDPTDPNHLIGGSNSISSDGAMRVYESFDGGQTWKNQKLPLAPAPVNGFSSDPAVTFDKQGNAYYSFLGIDSQGQKTSLVNLVKPKGSSNWGGLTTVPNVNADKNFMTSDMTTGPHSGNVYIAWDNNNADNSQQVRLATSSDQGKTWSTAKVNNQGTTVIGSDPKVGPNGEVYVAWANYADHTININKSTDGGKTFSPTDTQIHKWTAPTGNGLDVKIPADPERGVTTFPSIDVDRSNGPNKGTVYCAYMDGDNANGYHVLVQSSKDGGKTWSQPKQVDDPSGTTPGRHDHFMPRLAVDQSDGSVNVVWYDTRNDASNKKADVYYSRSTDGGQTFEANTRVSSQSSDETVPGAAPGAQGAAAGADRAGNHGGVRYGRDEDDDEDGGDDDDGPGPHRTTDEVLSDANGYGDYLGIAAANGKVQAFWSDSRPGNKDEDVYSATISHGQKPPDPTTTEVKGSAAPNAPIKDLQTTTSKIHFDQNGPIDSFKVNLDIDHTFRGDLVVQLIGPDGQKVDISNRAGGSADNLKGEFDLTSALKGKDIKGDWTLSVQDAAAQDEGKLNNWSIAAQVKPADPKPPEESKEVKQTLTPNAPIKDLQTTTSKMHFDKDGPLNLLKLNLDITHGWRGDLVVQLTSPQGKTVDISNRAGGSAKDLKGDFDLSSAFKDATLKGDWTLTVKDSAARDEGNLNAWSLDATVQ